MARSARVCPDSTRLSARYLPDVSYSKLRVSDTVKIAILSAIKGFSGLLIGVSSLFDGHTILWAYQILPYIRHLL